MTDLVKLMKSNKALYEAEYAQFRQVYGSALGTYWNNITGFDLFTFQDVMYPGQDEAEGSLEQAIVDKHGKEARDMIARLIGIDNATET